MRFFDHLVVDYFWATLYIRDVMYISVHQTATDESLCKNQEPTQWQLQIRRVAVFASSYLCISSSFAHQASVSRNVTWN